ncbi:intraflagellar transport protein 46 homolog [Episyrphus balteatus]|uniref:intraflagellar transport protein 46 homolog n=1 Tax=Episyrphus balteatus TaxID=286459 RepID=UPI00248561F4|nr:intraflagellar transport protein 46 homolog [Episyrphus balteatus]XP_055838610.1 intraflagellar transport protein 46 homolog [Episyrphus balteatus]XP_055838611.1 intraflagellar transport protein 46 homolog [Episyrphus balteatus]XP_055838612.1 intraflagellar transport protein 46 homolog [Episyrphus balteatus]
MNYYDEEIKIDGSEPIKLEKVQSASKGSRRASAIGSAAASRHTIRAKPDGLPRSSSTTTNEDDEHLDGAKGLDDSDASDSESEDSKEYRENQQLGTRLISPSSWDNLSLPQEIKEIFPYIAKYTPQLIETEYHLQPFVPEYVPAVGDVDAFLRVSFPAIMDIRREQDIQEHLQKMGLHFLDEPSGQQSEPSLLSIKLGSVLTGSARSHSASKVPIAKSIIKDVDKWITEVEHIHLGQSGHNVQPEKDIETMMIDWPQSYATLQNELNRAYNDDNLSLVEYIRVLCEKLEIDCGGPGELTQAQCIQKVYTLFSMYLAANHSYE